MSGGRDKQIRVLLIGPTPYRRKFAIARAFAGLKAACKVDKVLKKSEVEAELEALANVASHIKAASSRRVRLDTNVGRDEVEAQVSLILKYLFLLF